MPTSNGRSGSSMQEDPPGDGLPLSQSSNVVENDPETSEDDQQHNNESPTIGRAVSSSSESAEPVAFVIEALPTAPSFHSVKPRREKLKGTVTVPASAKVNKKGQQYIQTANDNIMKLENALDMERGYSDSLEKEGKKIIAGMQKTVASFHSKMTAGLKEAAKLSKKVADLSAQGGRKDDALKREVADHKATKLQLKKATTANEALKKQLEKAKAEGGQKSTKKVRAYLVFAYILASSDISDIILIF